MASNGEDERPTPEELPVVRKLVDESVEESMYIEDSSMYNAEDAVAAAPTTTMQAVAEDTSLEGEDLIDLDQYEVDEVNESPAVDGETEEEAEEVDYVEDNVHTTKETEEVEAPVADDVVEEEAPVADDVVEEEARAADGVVEEEARVADGVVEEEVPAADDEVVRDVDDTVVKEEPQEENVEPPQPEKKVLVPKIAPERIFEDYVPAQASDERPAQPLKVVKPPKRTFDEAIVDIIEPSQTLDTQDTDDDGEERDVEHQGGTFEDEIESKKAGGLAFPRDPKQQRFIYWSAAALFFMIVVFLGAIVGGSNKKSVDDLLPETNATAVSPLPQDTKTKAPTTAPTPGPTMDPLMNVLFPISGPRLLEPNSPQSRAFNYIQAEGFSNNDEKTTQRYAAVTIMASLTDGDIPGFVSAQECTWEHISCDLGRITGISMTHLGLTGSIPPEISSLSELTMLDLSENSIQGSLPQELFDLENLHEVYLNSNRLTGSIPRWIRSANKLEVLFLGQNSLFGDIPDDFPFSLRYISLNHNELRGEMPGNLLDRPNLFYLDLSFNFLSGRLPNKINAPALRHLYLSHNGFSGDFPKNFGKNLELDDFFADNNQFTGPVPSDFNKNVMFTMQIQNNSFDQFLDQRVCLQDVFLQGALIDLVVDCDICSCEGRFCESCVN